VGTPLLSGGATGPEGSILCLIPLLLLVAVIHRFGGGGGGADTLDRLDAATQTFQRAIYTFSDAGKSARDMRIVSVPQP